VTIYTKTGDRGETGLLGPRRVPKDHPRIEAYGDVDELNAAVGAARVEIGAAAAAADAPGRARSPALRDAARILERVQNDLFAIGALLAVDPGVRAPRLAPIARADVTRLERAIDRATARLPRLSRFVLPGGSRAAAALHVARTVCRRAERAVVALARDEPVPDRAIVYLNRLSDLLFTLARDANAACGVADRTWVPRKKGGA
jgi:cob(I)alamin adenosyltransferase